MIQTLIDNDRTSNITEKDILHQIKLSCKVPEIVEQIANTRAIQAAATAAKIEVTTEELQKAADQMRAISKLEDARTTWAWLNKHGLTIDDFEEIVRNTVISGKLAAHLFRDQVEPYFYEHQLDYAGAVIYNIILDDEDEAIELFYEIQEGEITFFEAAQQYIQDTELRRQGGYCGLVKRTDLPPEVSAAVFATSQTPQLLKPVVTSKGVYLIQVEEISQPQLDNKMRSQVLGQLFSEWLKQQTKQI